MSKEYIDAYTNQAKTITQSFDDGQVVVPDTAFAGGRRSRGIILGAPGNVEILLPDGVSTLILPSLVAGVTHPCRTTKIVAAGTTATSIVAVW
jgi:hypothetical protein